MRRRTRTPHAHNNVAAIVKHRRDRDSIGTAAGAAEFGRHSGGGGDSGVVRTRHSVGTAIA
eukprot:2463624-Pleurochrysis_carterae.AAC.2